MLQDQIDNYASSLNVSASTSGSNRSKDKQIACMIEPSNSQLQLDRSPDNENETLLLETKKQGKGYFQKKTAVNSKTY